MRADDITSRAPLQDAQPSLPQRRSRLTVPIISWIAVVLLVVFPKGGFKLAGIPITFGYMFLGCMGACCLIANLWTTQLFRMSRARFLTISATVPFQATILLSLVAYGTTSVGFSVSLLTTFVVMPILLVWLVAPQIDRFDLAAFLKFLRAGIFFIAAYGIFLFYYKLKTGNFIEIPFLTVNADDVGELGNKHINRGGVFKLISTYNNGNIFGASLIMLLPIYSLLEPSFVKRSTVKLALVLTLSRTAWIGLVLYELLERLYLRKVSLRALFGLMMGILVALIGIIYALSLLGFGAGFLLDSGLGGRAEQFGIDLTFTATAPFDALVEVVYMSVLSQFGLVGLAAFLLLMMTPLGLHLLRKIPNSASPYKRALALGMALYLIISWSDGAILYIPVMAFYWMMVSLLLSPNHVDLAFGAHRVHTSSAPLVSRLAVGPNA